MKQKRVVLLAEGHSGESVVIGVDMATGKDRTVESCQHQNATRVYESDDGEYERWLCPECKLRYGKEIAQ